MTATQPYWEVDPETGARKRTFTDGSTITSSVGPKKADPTVRRHAMVERDARAVARGMTQEESGLVSEDVWRYMVDALYRETVRDLPYGPKSRGRHHR